MLNNTTEPKAVAPPAPTPMTTDQRLDRMEQRLTRIETRLVRLMAVSGLRADGDRMPAPHPEEFQG